jgi:hypothetical protein
MDDRFASEDADELMERLLRVENAIFCLKARASYFPDMDSGELRRLEQLSRQIHAHIELRSRSPGEMVG